MITKLVPGPDGERGQALAAGGVGRWARRAVGAPGGGRAGR
jgi:hypothetical protein